MLVASKFMAVANLGDACGAQSWVFGSLAPNLRSGFRQGAPLCSLPTSGMPVVPSPGSLGASHQICEVGFVRARHSVRNPGLAMSLPNALACFGAKGQIRSVSLDISTG